MTNEMIIFWNAVDLMNSGLIGTTGRSVTIQDAEGNEKVLMEPEAIHTFSHWKELGYSVKKGEHAARKRPSGTMTGTRPMRRCSGCSGKTPASSAPLRSSPLRIVRTGMALRLSPRCPRIFPVFLIPLPGTEAG